MFRLFAIFVAILSLSSTGYAQIIIIAEPTDSDPPAAGEQASPPTIQRPAVLTSYSTCPTGYCFQYSNGSVINETFVDYVRRTGKEPPEARSTCATGYCGTFSSRLTLPTGGCACGCDASSCNCHHAPNAGKPLAQQKYNDSPRVPAAASLERSETYEAPRSGRGRLFSRLFRR